KECVGRYTGKGSPRKGDSSGCDWAAYGLFGTLGKGRIVLNEGKESEVFDFAEKKIEGGCIAWQLKPQTKAKATHLP
ncbi:VVA0879 family protein, partial [Rhodanobacter spathiphylli]|uniref:VVA0879 family protein n=1 Tax=Rhodanobacter spathiphylli TaxID=347483 RepID=UPI001930C6ED